MINAQITDQRALAARTPAEMAMYLRARHWTMQARDEKRARWTLVVEADEFEIEQPLDSDLRDYSARIRDIMRVLAAAEDRSELDILRDISNASMDVHSIRTFPLDSEPGMIGLDDGVQAFESLRSLVIAAAYAESSDQSRAVQPTRKPGEVLRFLRDVRIGAPAEGSFILSVHTPIPPRLSAGQPTLFDEATLPFEPVEPFERRVSLRIYDAVSAAHDAANNALVNPEGLEAFTQSVSRGVSANLCEALAGLGGGSRHPFELSLSIAMARPMTHRRFRPVLFRRDHLPVLEAAAQELRERIPEEGVVVVGNVVRLHREGSGSGEISVAGTIDGDDRLRRIWMNLQSDNYVQAMRAHQEMLTVEVRGDLVRRGTRLYMVNPGGFRTLADAETS